MTQRVQEILFALAIAGVFTVYAYLSTNFGPNARMIPLPMAIVGCLLTIVQLMRLVTGHEHFEESAEDPPAERAGRGNREMLALGGIVGMVVLILLVGPVTRRISCTIVSKQPTIAIGSGIMRALGPKFVLR